MQHFEQKAEKMAFCQRRVYRIHYEDHNTGEVHRGYFVKKTIDMHYC